MPAPPRLPEKGFRSRFFSPRMGGTAGRGFAAPEGAAEGGGPPKGPPRRRLAGEFPGAEPDALA